MTKYLKFCLSIPRLIFIIFEAPGKLRFCVLVVVSPTSKCGCHLVSNLKSVVWRLSTRKQSEVKTLLISQFGIMTVWNLQNAYIDGSTRVLPEFSNVRTKRKRRKNYFSGELNASRMTFSVCSLIILLFYRGLTWQF